MIAPYLARISLLKNQIPHHHLSGMIISKRENIHYLIGLSSIHPTNREALLFITSDNVYLYHSAFIQPPKFSWLKTFPMSPGTPLPSLVSQIFPTKSSIGIEGNNLTVNEAANLNSDINLKLEPIPNLVESFRQIKDVSEISAIQKACRITAKTMRWVADSLNRLCANHTSEHSLARMIENKLLEFGADGLAFPAIVAFDKHSASPHHLPQKSKITSQSIVLLDFGCSVSGYASDMTRTFFIGTPPPRFLAIESVVMAAYQAALKLLNQHFNLKVLTGTSHKSKFINHKSSLVTAAQVDETVRSIINQAGYGKNFIHTTGHALGLEIHEQPSINPQNNLPLQSGMVITIEPGIYLPGHFGYRHENTLLLQ